MNIDILTSDGSPLGVTMNTVMGKDPHQLGVGGAELGLLTLCELWQNNGHDVTLYNNPRLPTGSNFAQVPISSFNPKEDRDILIVFRTPYSKVSICKGKKIWLSTDQYTSQSFHNYDKLVDEVVCISKFHANYFLYTYGIKTNNIIPLPLRCEDFPKERPDKVHGRFIFTSVPDRGLANLWRMWPRILKKIPDASLVVTSDYRLWGAGNAHDGQHRVKWMVHDNVSYYGALHREQMISEVLKADIMLYPSNYDELQCLAVGEAQLSWVYPITTSKGALSTTNFGLQIPVDANDSRNDTLFVDAAVEAARSSQLVDMQNKVREKAIDEFSSQSVLQKWEDLFNA